VAGRRPVDVERLAAIAAKLGPRGDYAVDGRRLPPANQALLDAALAGAHLNAGNLVEAERDARRAVDFFATTDFITFHADSALILGEVLRATGRRAEAETVFQRALDLYRQKGSLVGAKTAAARLAS
jgi:tetratricopeptide (TPR) repeat protein